MFVYIILAIACGLIFGYVFLSTYRAKLKRTATEEGVIVFGEKIPFQDYLSLCNTCIAYLLISPEKKVDMTLFISKEKFVGDSWKDSMRMIRETINRFPIVYCDWPGDTTFMVNENETLDKLEAYQMKTQSDEYIIPLFDIGLVSRNPNLFSSSTKYQQANTALNVFKSRDVQIFTDPKTDEIVEGLETLGNDDYVVPVVHYSDRHVVTPKQNIPDYITTRN